MLIFTAQKRSPLTIRGYLYHFSQVILRGDASEAVPYLVERS
ncbi:MULTISPECIES: hypothetical protein [Calothrix]|nr:MULTISPECIES: hypothetical protein [Calothrix]